MYLAILFYHKYHSNLYIHINLKIRDNNAFAKCFLINYSAFFSCFRVTIICISYQTSALHLIPIILLIPVESEPFLNCICYCIDVEQLMFCAIWAKKNAQLQIGLVTRFALLLILLTSHCSKRQSGNHVLATVTSYHFYCSLRVEFRPNSTIWNQHETASVVFSCLSPYKAKHQHNSHW